ncbi:class I tRNA ligase family protein, partial [uncultured Nisaea sp.]|uniref:class I tRNA ligase family protein n=1 Tax=uncultured Nisaea sp. TaxID=538215 RepID=UPI0030EB9AA4
DEDVLDTWFSSALWPFSTLGWPEKTPELDRYYPGDVLVTGFDIIFFWVARMMMMGIHFMGEVPFSTVYIHALVRDQHGAKMSKSKGNVMDPLDLIEKFGTDALRFTLTAMAAQGRDIKLAESRVEGYRNFTTKLWNAARYAEMNECQWDASFDPKAATQTVNRWIISELAETEAKVSKAIDSYRFNDAAGALYHFIWGTYCDWYLEFTKPILSGADKAAAEETRKATAWVLMQAINLLNPLMPFITEELWSAFGGEGQLITTAWPDGLQDAADADAIAEMDWVVRLISEVRSIRSEMNVPAAAKIDLLLKDMSAQTAERLERNRDVILRLARLENISATDDIPTGAVQGVIDEAMIVLPIADVVDLAQERVRLEKDLGKLDGEIMKLDKKLSNESFISRAPAEVVEENRERLADEKARRDKLAAALERIAAL